MDQKNKYTQQHRVGRRDNMSAFLNPLSTYKCSPRLLCIDLCDALSQCACYIKVNVMEIQYGFIINSDYKVSLPASQ